MPQRCVALAQTLWLNIRCNVLTLWLTIKSVLFVCPIGWRTHRQARWQTPGDGKRNDSADECVCPWHSLVAHITSAVYHMSTCNLISLLIMSFSCLLQPACVSATHYTWSDLKLRIKLSGEIYWINTKIGIEQETRSTKNLLIAIKVAFIDFIVIIIIKYRWI